MMEECDVVKAHIHTELVFRRALALANVLGEISVEKVLAYPVDSNFQSNFFLL
jgi:hypothetical protein